MHLQKDISGETSDHSASLGKRISILDIRFSNYWFVEDKAHLVVSDFVFIRGISLAVFHSA